MKRQTRNSVNGKRKAATKPRGRSLTIEEKLRALALEIPKREWKKIPRDLSVNLDHYLYGFPKRW
ncbi:MAG: hypothetical protein HY238_21675 [Acidobacteria bacterium]|nr:hypothetical protein [Acidobacteriota bacterium]